MNPVSVQKSEILFPLLTEALPHCEARIPRLVGVGSVKNVLMIATIADIR